jgi:hypothetical protein
MELCKQREVRAMADFGLIAIPTHYSIQPIELARWAAAC